MLPSHLAFLYSSAQQVGSAAAFRTPELEPGSDKIKCWNIITYEQFQRDVELTANHWSLTFRRDGVPKNSVIGLWWATPTFFISLLYHIRQGFGDFLTSMFCTYTVFQGPVSSLNYSVCDCLIPSWFTNYCKRHRLGRSSAMTNLRLLRMTLLCHITQLLDTLPCVPQTRSCQC